MLFEKNRKRDPFKKIAIAHVTEPDAGEFGRRGSVPGEFFQELRSLLPYQAILVDFSAVVNEADVQRRMRTYCEAVSMENRRRGKTFACERADDRTLVAARF